MPALVCALLLAASWEASPQLSPGGGARQSGGTPARGARGSLPPGTAARGNRGMAAPVQRAVHAGIQMKSYVFEPTGEALQYALFVPPKAARSKAPVPLIVALHGLGSAPQMLVNDLTSGAERHGYIVVGPAGYRPDGWYGFVRPGMGETEIRNSAYSEQDVLNVLAIVRRDHNIDESRIYLAGTSMGGTGVLHLGRKYPGQWAAIAAMAPGVPDAGAGFEAMRDTPLMIMSGDRDELLPIEGTRKALARLRAAGVNVKYFEIRGGGHAAPILNGPPEVFRFFEKHKPAGK
jgi:predicted peptidase